MWHDVHFLGASDTLRAQYMFTVQVNCTVVNLRLSSKVKLNSFKNSLLFQNTHRSTKLSVSQRNSILCTGIKAKDVNSFYPDYLASNLEVLDRVKFQDANVDCLTLLKTSYIYRRCWHGGTFIRLTDCRLISNNGKNKILNQNKLVYLKKKTNFEIYKTCII